MLELKDVRKAYKHTLALDSVSLTLKPGVYALLGPNGAGKSTMMNLITGNLKPDQGQVLWQGEETKKLGRRFRRILGYAPQQQGLYDQFTGRRLLSYMAALKEIPRTQTEAEIQRAAAAVHLEAELDKRLAAYSGGMKQRILIAQALLGKPELLVLDEPTAGLDPRERIRVRRLLAQQAQQKIVLIATHVVSDIEGIADQIILLKKGRVAACGPRASLISEYAPSQSLEDVYSALFDQEEACG